MACTLLAAGLLALGAGSASGSPILVETIEVGGVANRFDVYDFVFVDEFGDVTMHSLNDDDGDTIVSTVVPPTPAVSMKFTHNQACDTVLITNTDPLPSPDAHNAIVPLIRNLSTGDSLIPSISVLDLGLTPSLPLGTAFTVVDGASPMFPNATILAPIMPFDDIPLPLFGDPGVFPPFTGTAEVVDMLDLTVIIHCAADIDANGDVNVTDLLRLLANWGPCPQPCPPDTNADGSVDVADLLELLAAWGPCPDSR